jgi:DNA-binding NarL/FixJ family response regulator
MDSIPIGRPIQREHVTNDCSSDVSRIPDRRGIVKAVRFLDPVWDAPRFVGKPLLALLEAIGGCDADRVVSALLQVESGVVEVTLHDGVFCVVSSRAVDEATVRVTVRQIESVVLPDMIAAKTARMARTRGLSEREQQVLQLLLRGRGVEDIATVLGIAPRTVKFHQANVLQKLGADSRLDLLRVVL